MREKEWRKRRGRIKERGRQDIEDKNTKEGRRGKED